MKKILLIILLNISLFSNAQNPTLQLLDAFPNLSFIHPLHLTSGTDGTNRIFVVQQNGIITVFPNDSNVTSPNKKIFLDISNKISASSGEEGLLGLTFHPSYSTNGYFYIDYTAPNPLRTVISRFKVSSGNPDKADSLSEYVLLEINQPFTNHNGGTVMFGLDGYLYIGMGDGGSSGDPNNNAQNKQVLLGKMLRININDTSATRRYTIPLTNPFYNNPTLGREEIFTWGMRNPWKYSQDPVTGLIYVADVGQNTWEEIDILQNGKNYGWRIMEGLACYNPPTNCDTTGLTLPIKVYGHTSGDCSITGGYVYRGNRRPELTGAYIYSDYCTGRISMLRYNNGVVTSDSLLINGAFPVSSFGVDQFNELYILGYSGGKIYRFNSSVALGLTAMLSGNYNGTIMVPKSCTVELHNSTTPYALVESKTVTLDANGLGNPVYTIAVNGTPYYIVLKFDNGLETWSATPQTFTGSALNYDFTSAATQAYGSNMLLVGTKWCIISGDANQDGSVDALDRSACWNDRNLSGVFVTDLNGDGVVDALDRSICWNNRNLSVQKPALLASPNSKGVKRDNKVNNGNSKSIYDLKLDGSNAKKVHKRK